MNHNINAVDSAVAAIQRLESRKLLSVSVVNGVLIVDTRDATTAQNIVVDFDPKTTDYRVTRNGHVDEFAQTGIDSLEVLGGAGPNFIDVQRGFPNAIAGDILRGGPANDTIIGSPGGHDSIFGGGGNDSLTGIDKSIPTKGPDDVIHGGAGNDTIVGGSGNDTVFGDGGNDSIQCGSGSFNEAFGGQGNDTIVGGANHDSLYGNGGADLLEGAGGGYLIEGGGGADTLLGGAGSSTLIGGQGNDVLAAGESDRLTLDTTTPILLPPSTGKDSLEGDGGNDTLIGVSADDSIGSISVPPVVLGISAADSSTSGTSTDTLSGGNGADEFNAPPGATLSDFNPAQGDIQASQQIYTGTPATDISIRLRIKINGTIVNIPSTAGNFDSDGNTSIAEVTSLDGNNAIVQFRDSILRTFVLGDFFNQWGISFSANGIAQFVNGPSGRISMTVNGVASTDFDNYAVRNGDVIVINFS